MTTAQGSSGRVKGVGWRRAPAAAAAAATIAAASIALGGTALAAPGVVQRPAGDPPSASAQAVAAALHVDANPAEELIFLVDMSDSMGTGTSGLYHTILQQLPEYMSTLAGEDARENKQDQVVVIGFGNPGKTHIIYGPGGPTTDLGLPPAAHLGTTDFGQAFAKALDLLGRPPSGVKVGGVVLLSDGGMSAPADPVYDGGKGYSAPGWKQLQTRAAELPIPVTGYAVPLTSDPAYVENQKTALTTVFSSVNTLPSATANLAGELDVAGQQAVYGEVTGAVRPDSGLGVQVTWHGLPADGDPPLNLTASGQRAITVTLTSRTAKVPLYVTGLNITSPGTSVTAQGALPGVVQLPPGKSVTVPVTLGWQPQAVGSTLTGGTRDMSGSLTLAGSVRSTWTPALQASYDDMSFSPGALQGSTAQFPVKAAAASDAVVLVILWLLVIAAILVALYGLARSVVYGTLTLTTVDGVSASRSLLPPFPVHWYSTRRLIGRQGWLLVYGVPFTGRLMVWLRVNGMPSAIVRLNRDGRTMAAGVDIRHSGTARQPARPAAPSHKR